VACYRAALHSFVRRCPPDTSFSIINHLAHVSKQELFDRVDAFVATKGMTEQISLIRKGALIARDPKNYELLEDLNEEEKTVIRNETLHKWRQPRALYLTVIICSVAAAVQYITAI
jgi:hypothetical protein